MRKEPGDAGSDNDTGALQLRVKEALRGVPDGGQNFLWSPCVQSIIAMTQTRRPDKNTVIKANGITNTCLS